MTAQFPKSFRPKQASQVPVVEEELPNAQVPDRPPQIGQLPKSFRAKEQQKPVEYPFEGDNDLEREIERHQARLTSRGLETLAGLPGDVVSFISDVTGAEPLVNLPTSKSLRETSEKLTRGYTTPQKEYEKTGDELFSDVMLSALPGGAASGFFGNIARTIGIPLAGTAVKESLKSAGVGEDNATLGKIGAMIGIDLASRRFAQGGIRKHLTNLYQKRNSLIPQGAIAESGNLETSLGALKKDLSKGGTATSTSVPLKKIDEVLGTIQNGQIPVDELTAFQRNINELIGEKGGFDIAASARTRRDIVKHLQDVKGEVIKALDQYGSKFNPEFAKANKSANEAYAAFSKSNAISNFINKRFGKKEMSPAVSRILGVGIESGLAHGVGLGAGSLLTGAATGAAGSALYGSGKVLYRVMKSPTLRKYYSNILENAARENTLRTWENIKKLEKGLEKEEKKQK